MPLAKLCEQHVASGLMKPSFEMKLRRAARIGQAVDLVITILSVSYKSQLIEHRSQNVACKLRYASNFAGFVCRSFRGPIMKRLFALLVVSLVLTGCWSKTTPPTPGEFGTSKTSEGGNPYPGGHSTQDK